MDAESRTPLMGNSDLNADYDATDDDVFLTEGGEAPLGKRRLSFSSGYTSFSDSSVALRLCFLAIIVYLALGVVAFSVIFERWTIIDSLYFGVVTFTTVGYGDFSPSTTGGRIFTIFFVLFGIVILGVALGIIGERLVEANEAAVEKTRKQSKARVIDTFSHDKGASIVIERPPPSPAELSEEKTIWDDCLDLLYKDFPLVALICLINLAMGYYQGWDMVTSLYYCIITTTTVGFGDLAPTTDTMRLLSVFFIPFGVAIMAQILGRVAGFYLERKAQEAERAFMNREFTLRDIRIMDTDHDESVSWGEFLSFMLVAMQKVDEDDIAELRAVFKRLDADGSGFLQKEDLILMSKRAKQQTEQDESETKE